MYSSIYNRNLHKIRGVGVKGLMIFKVISPTTVIGKVRLEVSSVQGYAIDTSSRARICIGTFWHIQV